jgi:hypothetical protein
VTTQWHHSQDTVTFYNAQTRSFETVTNERFLHNMFGGYFR